MAKPLKVIFVSTGEVVYTDIDGEKSLFRLARGESKRFIQQHTLSAGDIIYISKTGDRQFSVSKTRPTESTLDTILNEFNSEVSEALSVNQQPIFASNQHW